MEFKRKMNPKIERNLPAGLSKPYLCLRLEYSSLTDEEAKAFRELAPGTCVKMIDTESGVEVWGVTRNNSRAIEMVELKRIPEETFWQKLKTFLSL